MVCFKIVFNGLGHYSLMKKYISDLLITAGCCSGVMVRQGCVEQLFDPAVGGAS